MDLVIGIGNRWRGDDGVGWTVVEAIPCRPGVETVAVHQLVPELAERIQAAHRVLFVDASANAQEVVLHRIEPSPHRGLGHACSPGGLLSWTVQAYGAAPEAWLLEVPAAVFDPGVGLSPGVERRVPGTVAAVTAWLDRGSCAVQMKSEEEA